MTYITNTDWLIQVMLGNVAGYTIADLHGRNPDVDSAADEDVWPGGGTWVPPTAARTHQIVSTSTDDDAGGTGALTVKVEGLNGSFAEISETITMDGTTNVATANTYIHIQHLEVITAGSGGSNAGVITATADTDSTVSNQIAIGVNHDELCAYMVPNGKAAYLLGYGGSVGKATGSGDSNVKFLHKDGTVTDGVYTRIANLGLLAAGSSHTDVAHLDAHAHTAQHIIKGRSDAGSNNTEINAHFDLLIKDV